MELLYTEDGFEISKYGGKYYANLVDTKMFLSEVGTLISAYELLTPVCNIEGCFSTESEVRNAITVYNNSNVTSK